MTEHYPSAPPAEPRKRDSRPTGEHERRQAWFNARNEAIQRGVKAPKSGTFGKAPK